ncbi:MAG: tetratricopeptide repeat protein, partial [Gammaproteobacteria bacterium]
MLNYKLIAVITLIFLNGCGFSPEKVKIKEEAIETESQSEGVKQVQNEEMATAIDPDVMYMLLVAEIAGQREQYDVALEAYLEAARRVDDVRLAERAAKIALYIKDINKADEAVALWLKQDPENLTARKIALLSALKNEMKDPAVDNAIFFLDKDPEGFEVTMLELLKALGPKGNIAFVYDVLDGVAEQRPDQAAVYFVQSMLAMQLNSNVLARQKVEKALAIDPDWDEALMFQAQIAAYSGDMARAETLLTRMVEKDPENIKAKKLLAQVLIKSSEYEAAGKVYSEILNNNPKDAESIFSLALVYLQLKQDDKAEPLFEELLDYPGWQDQASFYLGRIAVRDGRVEDGLVWFDKVTSGSFRFDASVAAISVLIKEKKFDEAKSRIRKLRVKTEDQKLRSLLVEAELYNEQKQYSKAFELLSDALEDMPEQKDLLYTRALVAERIDRLDVLELDLKKILAQYPEDVSALNALGYTLADRTQRYLEAQQYLEKAIGLKPDEAVIIDSYGWLQFKLNNLDVALDYLQRAYS